MRQIVPFTFLSGNSKVSAHVEFKITTENGDENMALFFMHEENMSKKTIAKNLRFPHFKSGRDLPVSIPWIKTATRSNCFCSCSFAKNDTIRLLNVAIFNAYWHFEFRFLTQSNDEYSNPSWYFMSIYSWKYRNIFILENRTNLLGGE